MAIFSLLAEPEKYKAETWDVSQAEHTRGYWLKIYANRFGATMRAAEHSPSINPKALSETIDKAKELFASTLEQIKEQPNMLGVFGLMTLEKIRYKILRKFVLQDAFLKIKHKENIKASNHYPRLIKAHDKLKFESLIKVLTEGIFAGEVFDLNDDGRLHCYDAKEPDFFHTLDGLQPRPWLIDDFDKWREFLTKTHGKLKRVMFFVDNAGADFVLGCIPLARILAQQGTTVYLAAADRPCYNDITTAECRAVLQALCQDDPLLGYLLKTKRLRLTGLGGGLPHIDFLQIAEHCDRAAEGAELIILSGSPRAVESNWLAKFNCPTLKIATMTNKWHAQRLGGELYDLVCRFELPTT